MAGHSKWSQIKRQKGAADAHKSRAWGKLAKRIVLESKKANGDVSLPGLRAVIETAKKDNMPKDSIERAIAKGASTDSAAMESITYETYGPGGCAIVITGLTDNRNRTAQEIKHLLDKNGLGLAAQGSALWAFEKTAEGFLPKTTIPLSAADNDALMKILEQVDAHDDVEDIYTNAT